MEDQDGRTCGSKRSNNASMINKAVHDIDNQEPSLLYHVERRASVGKQDLEIQDPTGPELAVDGDVRTLVGCTQEQTKRGRNPLKQHENEEDLVDSEVDSVLFCLTAIKKRQS